MYINNGVNVKKKKKHGKNIESILIKEPDKQHPISILLLTNHPPFL